MRWFPSFVALCASFALVIAGDSNDTAVSARPALTVPGLTQIRDILARLEAPIISTLTDRLALPSSPALYASNGAKLLAYLHPRELAAASTGRYAYGRLEYPFTLPPAAPDTRAPPPGTFRQDAFCGNANISAWYAGVLAGYFGAGTAYWYHLGAGEGEDNKTVDEDEDAILNLDATLLALLSHRAHIGKIVAESKYAANVTGFTPLIQSGDAEGVRALVTNTTQEAGVYAQAAAAASAFAGAWGGSGNATAAAEAVFRELVGITTEIEVQYLLQRLD